MAGRPLLLAHRGDHRKHPENSVAAFRAALAVRGIDGVELDVRAARDGTPIVLHDATLLRVQGRPERVTDLDPATLASVGVPRLADVLAALPATSFVDVELKEDVVTAAVQVIRRARGDPPTRLALSSFETDVLGAAIRAAPAWPRWLNADDLAPATLARALGLGCAAVSVALAALDETGLRRARGHGLEVAAWTVRSLEELERAIALGVAAVCLEGPAMDAIGRLARVDRLDRVSRARPPRR